MINARPGYWDMDRCCWVGVEPTYVVPPLRHADRAAERDIGGQAPRVPAPRHRRPETADEPALDSLDPAGGTADPTS